jgi:hypothetical protein
VIRVEVAGLLQTTTSGNTTIPGAQVQLCNDNTTCVGPFGYAGGYAPGTTLFRIEVSGPPDRYWVVVVTPNGYAGGQYTLKVTHP